MSFDNFVETSSEGSAVFSRDRRHRYLLTRTLRRGTGLCCFVLLNPSKADACANDPTIARCIGFTRRWGFAEMRVVNLFSLMATDPGELFRSSELCHGRNLEYLLAAANDADVVVAGWGRNGAFRGRSSDVLAALNGLGVGLLTFGLTKNGEPRHPLYVPYTARLRPVAPATA